MPSSHSLRALLTRPVLASVANYASLALLDIAAGALMSLVWSTLIMLSGLGLTPTPIGLWLSAYGCASALFQFAFFPRLVARFGPECGGVCRDLRPLRTCWLAGGGTTAVMWPLIALQLLSRSVSDMGRGFHVHLFHGAE
ncbi:hypothetical protein EDB92DRAFT_1868958 [Lactarius akahatsu]|uniref:Uncharacterized protein n=1 Tax=Lactarius akahatsu TaxID=416441 RepID=A0AAD4LJ72_9AGAM|nr:hypothetical protein EDB92DRAFT_1868958 [Lactarius akahatsu]